MSFYAILSSVIVNILLEVLFVLVFRWHVNGVALETIISQLVMTIFKSEKTMPSNDI